MVKYRGGKTTKFRVLTWNAFRYPQSHCLHSAHLTQTCSTVLRRWRGLYPSPRTPPSAPQSASPAPKWRGVTFPLSHLLIHTRKQGRKFYVLHLNWNLRQEQGLKRQLYSVRFLRVAKWLAVEEPGAFRAALCQMPRKLNSRTGLFTKDGVSSETQQRGKKMHGLVNV